MIKIFILLAVLLVLVTGCDGNQGGGMMGGGGMMANVEIKGGRPPPETKPKHLQGYQLAQMICSQCHIMPNPNQHTSAEWPDVIARMAINIDTFKRNRPNKRELNTIVEYYVANAR